MDPLAMSTSSLAPVDAAASPLTIGVQLLYSLSRTSDEQVLWMLNELTDVRAVLHVLSEHVSSATEPLQNDKLASLEELASRASQTINELQHFIDNNFLVKIGLDKKEKPEQFFSQRAWIRLADEIRRLKKRSRDCRLVISQELSAMSPQRVPAVQYDIEGLCATYPQILRALRQPQDSPVVFVINATVPPQRCGPDCICICHTQSPAQSPAWPRRLVGYLFIGYSGVPYTKGRECSLESCCRASPSSLPVSYRFPSHLLSKMLSCTVAWNDLMGIQKTIRFPSFIKHNSTTWTRVRLDKTRPLRMTFDRGLAFPADMSQDGTTLLHFAMECQAYNTAAMLLEYGADPHATDDNTSSPCHMAWVQLPAMNQVERNTLIPLLEKIREEETIDTLGLSTLHQSILGIKPRALLYNRDITGRMLESGDIMGWTPLHWAVNYADTEAIAHLLELGCDVNTPNNLGETPLHIACEHGTLECVKMLLAAGASVIAETSDESVPLHYAVKRRDICVPIITLLTHHEE
ncbi:ankyrin repeat-containing domain protein [Podospora didyma]|uniref:Ankyrin repeat-containing domain protein n=1 Tax=Podospora didyma TaxID=330526 RepID=A0AAE0K8N7_9PEZI|nr:ankyrin repeat-containing domain protein [Podospora didyma]